ncbi:acyl-CoA dehydrogenase family protein [Virgibacillus sp. CBA3643]|uniref:acyl-CoA dehydrogenase family protein n=1 Tax=Virgibacillus sp. CBA3643 TaxID=2942278 RepID=UPI0035A346F2
MISFQPTEDETALADVAKNIAKDVIRPKMRSCEELKKVEQTMINEITDLGFLSLEFPEFWDGLELPLITQVQLWQALSYGDLDVVQGLPGSGDVTSMIRVNPENTVLKRYKDDLINQKTAALLDIADVKETSGNHLTVRKDTDGYALQGDSQPVRMATFASYVAVAAKDLQGNTVILWLDNGSQWTIDPGDYRLGLLASGLGRFSFDGVKVPDNQVIAKGHSADDLLQEARTRIHIIQAAKEVGLMEAALDYTTEYTAGRKAFGQEIAKFQGVSFRIAKMAMETRSANHLVWEAALKADKGDASAEGLALRALNRAHRSVRYVTDSAVQLLGGHGFVQDFPVEKWMRDAQAQVALYGSEKQLLVQHGGQLIAGKKEEAVQ